MSTEASLHLWGIEPRSAGPRGKISIWIRPLNGGSGGGNCNSASFIHSATSPACSFLGCCTLSPNGKGVEREGNGENKGAEVGGPPIHSGARTRSVVIRVPTRMINEALWGPRKFVFCWGPEEWGSIAGCICRRLEGSGFGGSCPIFLPVCQVGAAIIRAFSHQSSDTSIWTSGVEHF